MSNSLDLPYNAVMVDIETLSTANNAAITAIGAVKFWINVKQTEFTDDQLFYTSVSLKTCQKEGLHIDADTVMWWLNQKEEARNALKNPASLRSALGAFSRFIPGAKTYIFGNGATFDNIILKSAYSAIGGHYPVSYKYDVCYRTLCKISPTQPPKFEGTKHNALDDAKAQTRHLMEILEQHPWVCK